MKDANRFIFGEIISKAYKMVYGDFIKVWEGMLNSKETQKYKRTLVNLSTWISSVLRNNRFRHRFQKNSQVYCWRI